MKSPIITFVVPCYNYGCFVSQAIDSVLTQTLQDVEIIVIDDCSTDHTPEVLSAYAQDDRVRVIRHPENQGHIRTYNEGLALAKGRYVGLLSADDYCLKPYALARQAAIFEAYPHVGLVYSAHLLVPTDGPPAEIKPWPEDYVHAGLDEFRQLMWANYVPASGTLVRREVQHELGPYDARLPHAGDWDMWLRAFARHDVGYIAEPLYGYRLHERNMSHKRISPSRATEDVLLTMDKAFAALPRDARAEMRALRRQAMHHALFRTAWLDLYHGHRSRTWQSVVYALRRHPLLALGKELPILLPQLLLMTVLGKEALWRVMARIKRLLGAAPTGEMAAAPGDG